MATGSVLPWQSGVMWGWCKRNMPLYGHPWGHVSGLRVLRESPISPMAGSIRAAAPENACCRALCSHSEAAPKGANTSPVVPFPSASHPSLNTQVGS